MAPTTNAYVVATNLIITDPKGQRKDVESDNESDSDAESYASTQYRLNSKPDAFYLDKLHKTYKKREELHLAEKPKQKNPSPITHPSQERSLVRDDDVCIHVIGLPGSLTPEDTFSAIFGIFEERKVWKVQGTLFEIFEGKDRFYHRDQLVPINTPVQGLSVNYHGELLLTSDRMEIISHGEEFATYRARLAEAVDKAISTIPELAVLILKSMLRSNQNRNAITPQSQRYAAEYKLAFEAACGQQPQAVYPFARRAMEEDLIREFEFAPWPLHDWQMQILEDAGAYISIKKYAQNRLEEAVEVPEKDLPGLIILNRCVRQLLPELKHDVSVRQYHYSTPRALHRHGRILLAQPRPCNKCTECTCSCWVGPALVRVMQECDENADLDNIFWVYSQEKKLADQHERLSTQNQGQNSTIKFEDDDLPRTASGEIGGRLGSAAECSSGEDDTGNGTSGGRVTRQARGNYKRQAAKASKFRTKVSA